MTPRALAYDEIPTIVAAFARAAEYAQSAGFVGVEIHAANGYLIDEFLRDGSNKRPAPYGGNIEKRIRLLLEIVDTITPIWGSGRVGVRTSPLTRTNHKKAPHLANHLAGSGSGLPHRITPDIPRSPGTIGNQSVTQSVAPPCDFSGLNSFNDMRDSDPAQLTRAIAGALSISQIAYLHVMRADLLGIPQGDILSPDREAFQGPFFTKMAYTREEANAEIAADRVDAVVFDVPFIGNPDLVHRFAKDLPLPQADPTTFCTNGPEGYIDYPALSQETAL